MQIPRSGPRGDKTQDGADLSTLEAKPFEAASGGHVLNVAQVASEAAKSPGMVFWNYRELVRTADAEKSFGITPEAIEDVKLARQNGAVPKIVPLQVAAA